MMDDHDGLDSVDRVDWNVSNSVGLDIYVFQQQLLLILTCHLDTYVRYQMVITRTTIDILYHRLSTGRNDAAIRRLRLGEWNQSL